jgi:hypothetical protein
MPLHTALRVLPLFLVPVTLTSPRVAAAQEIQITGPIGCAPAAVWASPARRTRVEVLLGMGALGEVLTSVPPGARPEGGVTTGLSAEARFAPRAAFGQGAAIGVTLGLGPTLRLPRDPVLAQVVADAAHVFHTGIGRFDSGNTEHHVIASVELGISGRWAFVEGAKATTALGPRVGLGVDDHKGRLGRTIWGLGLDVRPLYEIGAGTLHSVLVAAQLRVGWDLPPLPSPCDD